MKRFLSMMMASVLMVLTFSTALTAMAGTPSGATGNLPDNMKIELYYTYEEETNELVPDFQIEIAVPDSMTFNYKAVYKQEWDNDEHKVKTVLDESESGWTTSKYETAVDIENYSNVGVQAFVQWQEEDGYEGWFTLKTTKESGSWLSTDGGIMTVNLEPTAKPTSGSLDATEVGQLMIYVTF